MKKQFLTLLAAVFFVLPLFCGEQNGIQADRVTQDKVQPGMTTKVYQLKTMKASDIAKFVDTAVRRYNSNSTVRCLNFSAVKEQTLIVTTAAEFLPYVDRIIATLDCARKKDRFGSAIAGSGYQWHAYHPRYRRGDPLRLAADMMLSCNGHSYCVNDMLWIKDDPEDVSYAFDWVKYFDRPLPQAKMTFRWYVVRSRAPVEAKLIREFSLNVINDQNFESAAAWSTSEGKSDNPVNMKIVLDAHPVICFHADEKEINEYGWIPTDRKFYDKNRGVIIFSAELTVSDASGIMISSLSSKMISFGREQMLVKMIREYEQKQPEEGFSVLKYLFGSRKTVKEKKYVIVTVEADLVYPEPADAKKHEE